MDQKTWRWRKKPSEKTATMNAEINLPTKEVEEMNYIIERNKDLERSVEFLNENILTAIAESNAKDDLVEQNAKVAEEAIAGWEKTEAEVLSLKKELEDTLRLRKGAEDRVLLLDSALKECMMQLRHTREEQEKNMHEAVIKNAREFDRMRINLEDRLDESNKMICELEFEKSELMKALAMRDKLIDQLNEHKCQTEKDFDAILVKVNCIEKINSSLKYEGCMLRKEVEIRNEEMEFSRKAAEASTKQHLDDVKKITKLETECQRLRLLVRKRLPGPAALAKMKHEVEALGHDNAEARRRISNPVMGQPENGYENKRIAYLTEQLSIMEEENKQLKKSLKKVDNELLASRIACQQTAMRDSPSKAGTSEIGKYCSSLLSEVGNFQIGKSKSTSCRSIEASDLSLMDDFAEMEKLALISAGGEVGGSQISDKENNSKALIAVNADSEDYIPNVTGKELVPVEHYCNNAEEKSISWLEEVLMLILQESKKTKRSFNVIIEDVRHALMKIDGTGRDEALNSKLSDSGSISGYITWKTPCSSSKDSYNVDGTNTSMVKTSGGRMTASVLRSLQKITELIEGINYHEMSSKENVSSTTYTVRVVQWRTSEVCDILHHFSQSCNDLLQGLENFDIFFKELYSTLDWIIKLCFPIKDVLSIGQSMKKYHGQDNMHSDQSEVKECRDNSPQMAKVDDLKLFEESKQLKDETDKMVSRKILLEDRLQSTKEMAEILKFQLQQSGNRNASSHKEVALSKGAITSMEKQDMNQNLLSNVLDTEIGISKKQINEAHEKILSLELEPENRSTCENLDPKESVSVTKDSIKNMVAEEGHVNTKWDNTKASEKLVECQESILNLRKQVKALASPRDSALVDKEVTASSPVKIRRRASLLDQILAEDYHKDDEMSSPKTKEIICLDENMDSSNPMAGLLYGSKLLRSDDAENLRSLGVNKQNFVSMTPLAVVSVQPKGYGSFLKKLLSRKKRESNKRVLPAIPAR